ncbi:MAG: AAA family ATPase [Acidimicrobiia bacterium]
MGVVTVVFTDLVGSTAHFVRLGHDASERIRREHFRTVRDAALPRAGREVKSTGDGLMIVFDSPLAAVETAVAVQRATGRRNRGERPDAYAVRIGVNVGEADEDQGDFYGLSVSVARRLCDSAEPGEILVSRLINDLVGSRSPAPIEPAGTRELKGLDPVEVHRVRWEPAVDGTAVPPALAPRDRRFVGRTEQLTALAAAWQACQQGGAQVALVVGEPGIGKTTLAAEVAAVVAADGGTVLYGRCEDPAIVPYQPFVEAIRTRLAGTGTPPGDRRWPVELTRLVPGLDGPVPAEPSDPATARYRVVEAVTAFVERCTQDAPTLLVLDDLHWTDHDTMALVEHLVRAAATWPLLVVATYRDTDVRRGHPLLGSLARLRRRHPQDRHHLAGLDTDDLVALTGLERQFAATIVKETNGNPLFALEVARDCERHPARRAGDAQLPLPDSLRAVVEDRVEQLGTPTRELLAAACTLGTTVELAVLRAMLDLPHEDLDDALDEALVAHLLVEDPDDPEVWLFPHNLIRTALADRLDQDRRQELHAAAARALAQASRLDLGPRLIAQGVHVRAAGPAVDDAAALELLLAAADGARRLGAWGEVVADWDAALARQAATGAEPAARARLLERVGDLRYATGIDRTTGARDLRAAASIYEERGDEVGRARIHSRMGRNLSSYPEAMDVPRAMDHYRQATRVLDTRPDDPANAYLAVGMAGAALYGLLNAEGLAAAERAHELATRLGLPGLAAQAEALRGGHLAYRGRLADGLCAMAGATELADGADDAFAGFIACWIRSWAAVLLRDPGEAIGLVEAELAKPRLATAPVQRSSLHGVRGVALLVDGRVAEARRLDPDDTGNVPLFAPMVHYVRGDWRAAAEALAATGAVLLARGNKADYATLTPWLARAQVRAGQHDAALVALDEALTVVGDGPCPYVELANRAEMALLGHDPARQLDRCAEILAGGDDWRGLATRVHLARAVVDDDGAALDLALELSRRYGLVWDQGEVLERAGRVEEAREVYLTAGATGPWLA